ncbi:MAG: hypothetical protein CSA86_02545 [Arcobacter sp.]|nr:MAG: hypothetical protein CSA86_02545 [Arcobacter sp.]
MNNIRFKKLDLSKQTDRHILLTYFFKKLDTTLNKEELLKISCIYYNAKEEKLSFLTNRFTKKSQFCRDIKVLQENVDDTLKKVLCDELTIHEELVRCDLDLGNRIDYFYIAVIGVDFFLTETELRK